MYVNFTEYGVFFVTKSGNIWFNCNKSIRVILKAFTQEYIKSVTIVPDNLRHC